MSTLPIIDVEGIAKCYKIGHESKEQYNTLRDQISKRTKSVFSFFNPNRNRIVKTVEDFWALSDISFTVQQGDRVGVLGRNGAGKSTLLKILSRITEPTKGKIHIRGRVASLLEVGTGFHPELTGRENIFLNGAILGMSRAEIKAKFDEIVDFAEVERFLDTPVKRYSSGMYVRLAFSVAAHLEPEILIVDEVLAVGDAQFQQKCLGKMEDVSKEHGRTVLFVSHNMGAITALCNKGVLLSAGKIEATGNAAQVISTYLQVQQEKDHNTLLVRKDRSGSGSHKFSNISFEDEFGNSIEQIISGAKTNICFSYVGDYQLNRPHIKYTIYSRTGQPLSHFDSNTSLEPLGIMPSSGTIKCSFSKFPFSAGLYTINVVILEDGKILDYLTSAISFNVISGNFFESGKDVSGMEDISLHAHHWIITG